MKEKEVLGSVCLDSVWTDGTLFYQFDGADEYGQVCLVGFGFRDSLWVSAEQFLMSYTPAEMDLQGAQRAYLSVSCPDLPF